MSAGETIPAGDFVPVGDRIPETGEALPTGDTIPAGDTVPAFKTRARFPDGTGPGPQHFDGQRFAIDAAYKKWIAVLNYDTRQVWFYPDLYEVWRALKHNARPVLAVESCFGRLGRALSDRFDFISMARREGGTVRGVRSSNTAGERLRRGLKKPEKMSALQERQWDVHDVVVIGDLAFAAGWKSRVYDLKPRDPAEARAFIARYAGLTTSMNVRRYSPSGSSIYEYAEIIAADVVLHGEGRKKFDSMVGGHNHAFWGMARAEFLNVLRSSGHVHLSEEWKTARTDLRRELRAIYRRVRDAAA